MVLVPLTFLNCYMSTLCLVHYALLLTPACWKSSNTNARLMAFALSLALDPTFGIHSHRTLDTAQPCHLLKPNWKASSSHSISTHSFCYSQCASVCVCVCMRVCVFPYNTLRKLFLVGLCCMCVQNIVFSLICIMWALRELTSAW